MHTLARTLLPAAVLTLSASPAAAVERAEVTRVDAQTVVLSWSDSDPVTVLSAADADTPVAAATVVAPARRGGTLTIPLPAGERRFFMLRDGGDGSLTHVAERVLPLEQGSNFRDVGGYTGAGGQSVKWGRIYRSGAMPLLTERDYAVLSGLKLSSIVDLRSTDERMIAPNMLDDRTGALFITNDYSLKTLMAGMAGGDGEYAYRGIGKALAPQYRAIFRRLLANEGPVMYHCSAGQDRTGVATALVLAALGVDRPTILADYHLSTALRRPQFEMPPLNPTDWPGNPIVPYYVASQKAPGGPKAEPLYTRSGVSHLARFFEVIDRDYGGVEGYLDRELGVKPADVAHLRKLYLE